MRSFSSGKVFLVLGHKHKRDDKRVWRTVKALSKNGFVCYQYLTTDSSEKRRTENGVLYIPVYIGKNRDSKDGVIARFRKWRSLDKQLFREISGLDYELAYLHGLPLTCPVLFLRFVTKANSIIWDIHEYFPLRTAQNLFKNKILNRFKEKIFASLGRIFAEKFCSGLVLVSDAIHEGIGFNPKLPYIVVPNYAGKVFMKEATSKKNDFPPKNLVIVGKTPRDFKKELALFEKLKENSFDIHFVGFDKEKIGLRNLDNFVFHEFMPYEKMMEFLAGFSFSFISYENSAGQYGLPNKFFDSLAAGVPVIVNKNFDSMRRIVEEKNVGIVIDPIDAELSFKITQKALTKYFDLKENIKRNMNYFVWDNEKENHFSAFVKG